MSRFGNIWTMGDGELLLITEDRLDCAQNLPIKDVAEG
jgi:hypothetical protein